MKKEVLGNGVAERGKFRGKSRKTTLQYDKMINKLKKINFIIVLSFLIGFFSCEKSLTKGELYIISKQDSLERVKPDSIAKLLSLPLGMDFYYDIVVIFDSIDKVYLYQTKLIKPDYRFVDFTNGKNAKGSFDKLDFKRHKFPNFIELHPDNLLTFESNSFIEFIKSNNDIFKLDTIRGNSIKLLYIASVCDTIRNKAFYDFKKYISTVRKNANPIISIIRRTTEEEDSVLFFKRKKLEYIPQRINWTSNFIAGKFKPCTKEYDSVEKIISYKVKAIITIKNNSMIVPVIN